MAFFYALFCSSSYLMEFAKAANATGPHFRIPALLVFLEERLPKLETWEQKV
jgi:hypothetical protein